MRVRVTLAQSPEANAVGSLELECLAQGLLIVFVGVGAYSPGYAVGAVTSGAKLIVPWASIERLEERTDHVLLTFDSRLSPHNRLCLARFADGTAPDPVELERRRRLVRIASIALMLVVGVSLASQLPAWSEHTSQWLALALGCGAGLMVLAAGALFERFLLVPPPDSDGVRAAFVAQLALHRPVLRSARPEPEAEPFDWNALIQLLPRSTLAIVILISSASLATLATTRWLGAESDQRTAGLRQPSERVSALAAGPTEPEESDNAGPSEPLAAESKSESPAATPSATPALAAPSSPANGDRPMAAALGGDSCRCSRPDSILWGDGFPRITTLLIEQSTRRHKDHQHLEIELGAINNGRETLSEIHLSVQFFEGNDPEPIRERPLYYEGPLRPGQAIKWHVQARGTRFLVHNPTREVLTDRTRDFAPADAFARLLESANFRPVRLHGSLMLAFLGDARAAQGALGLKDALREAEAPYLDRVLSTQGDVITCDLRAAPEGRKRALSACVYNRGKQRQEHVTLKGRALDRHFDHRSPTAEPPIILAEQAWELDRPLESEQGSPIALELDTDNGDGKPPVAFELLVDPPESR